MNSFPNKNTTIKKPTNTFIKENDNLENVLTNK